MSTIRVTCNGCHTRFNVSEKFAGREGPCPKCKKSILIPAPEKAVQVHERESFGPKTATGASSLKPIFRKDASVSAVQWVLIGAVVVGFVAIAFLLRMQVTTDEARAAFSSWILVVAAILLAAPCVYAGYTFLRGSELGGYDGQELWGRVAMCAAVYGLSWLLIPVIGLAMDNQIGVGIGVALMFGLGAFAAFLLLGIDYMMGILHYGLFFGCSILLRTIAGFGALPSIENSGGGQDIDDLLKAAIQSVHFFV